MTIYSSTLKEVIISLEPQAHMLSPFESINIRESQDLLPTLSYMAHHNKETLQEVRGELTIGKFEQWLDIKNDQDYLHTIEKKLGLLVRHTGCCIYKYLCVATEVLLEEISFSYADLDSLFTTSHHEVIPCSD